MRSDKELLKILIDHYSIFDRNHPKSLCSFISYLVTKLEISIEESDRLSNILLKNKPKDKLHFGYWFPIYDSEIRLDFLRRIMEDMDLSKESVQSKNQK